MKHLLAVGATGMLAPALADLSRRARRVSSLARSASRNTPAGARPYDSDWTDAAGFRSAVEKAIADHGPPTHALIWMHRTGERSARWLLGALEAPCEVVHVLGSSSGDPRAGDETWQTLCAPGVERRAVVLGAVREAGSTRWLTHEEISAGALRAFDERRSLVVGELGLV